MDPVYNATAFNVSGATGDTQTIDVRGGRGSRPVIATAPDQDLAIAWSNCESQGDGRGCGVFYRRYQLQTSNLLPIDSERISLSSTTQGDQVDPSFEMLPDGSLAGAWTSRDPDRARIRGRVFAPE